MHGPANVKSVSFNFGTGDFHSEYAVRRLLWNTANYRQNYAVSWPRRLQLTSLKRCFTTIQNKNRFYCYVFNSVNFDHRGSENFTGRINLLKPNNMKQFSVFLHLTAILTTILFVNIITRYILKTVDLRRNWNRQSASLLVAVSSFAYWRHAVAQSAEELRCKPEVRGFIHSILPAALWP
jgi:hypothetical protein